MWESKPYKIVYLNLTKLTQMKFVITTILFIVIGNRSHAQVIDDVAGKTYYYYDEGTHKKMKEVFHHKQMVKIMPDPNNYGSYIDSVFYVKNGPYTRYHENGNLQCSGTFKNEKKDSVWKYYDANGKLTREEKYANGELVK